MKDSTEAIQKATDTGFNNAIEQQHTGPWYRAGIALIPVIGSSINELLGHKLDSIREERIKLLYEEMAKTVVRLEAESIDKGYFQTEEFFDLFFVAYKAAWATRHKQKIQAYAQVLIGAGIRDNQDQHDPELYLTILTELLPVELHVLKALYGFQKVGPAPDEHVMKWEKKHHWSSLIETTGMEEAALRLTLQRLERTGLVTQVFGYKGAMDDRGHFIISDLMRNLMTFLQQTSFDE
jgi:hypothetical protein